MIQQQIFSLRPHWHQNSNDNVFSSIFFVHLFDCQCVDIFSHFSSVAIVWHFNETKKNVGSVMIEQKTTRKWKNFHIFSFKQRKAKKKRFVRFIHNEDFQKLFSILGISNVYSSSHILFAVKRRFTSLSNSQPICVWLTHLCVDFQINQI